MQKNYDFIRKNFVEKFRLQQKISANHTNLSTISQLSPSIIFPANFQDKILKNNFRKSFKIYEASKFLWHIVKLVALEMPSNWFLYLVIQTSQKRSVVEEEKKTRRCDDKSIKNSLIMAEDLFRLTIHSTITHKTHRRDDES